MALIPLPVEDLEMLLVTGVPSGPQYATYLGKSDREKFSQTVESITVSLLGVILCYCLSFVLGGFVATLFGALFAFYGVLSPEFKARQRNWELLAGRELVDPYRSEDYQGLFGSLYIGHVQDVCVVEDELSDTEYDLLDFKDYDMNSDELEKWSGSPYQLRLRLTDSSGRELQVHTRMVEEYVGIESGMPAVSVLLSPTRSFGSLAGLTDVMIPDVGCWVGDYPYLNRPEMEAFIAEDEVFDLLESETVMY